MANLNHRIQIYNGRNDAQSISFTIPMTDPEIRENPSRVGWSLESLDCLENWLLDICHVSRNSTIRDDPA